MGETEGITSTWASLKYQVQLSRILNPADVEDPSYLAGLARAWRPGRGETWFGIFMRVAEPEHRARRPRRDFTITDTQENEFKPVPLERANPFAYGPEPLRPGAVFPTRTRSGEGDIGVGSSSSG